MIEGAPASAVYLTARRPSDGSLAWTTDLSSITRLGPPAVAPDGMIVVVTKTSVVAVTQAGTVKWSVPVNNAEATQQPTIDSDGNIYYFADDGNTLASLSPSNGAERWRLALTQSAGGPIVLGPGGVIYVQEFAETMIALTP
jgi:outer membrane protein assembly factor BamB